MSNGIFLGDILEYLERLAPRREALFKEMEAYALENDVPIVGPHVGALLHIIAKMSNAKKILELGTAIGYSGTWLAKALPSDGKLITIEWDKESARIANENFEKGGVSEKIELKVGSAHELLPKMKGRFDIIFNDIDKEGYVDILPYCISHIKKGGLLITDNILWEGNAAKKLSKEDDLETVTIREYTKRIFEHPELFTVIVPIRDGISISMRL